MTSAKNVRNFVRIVDLVTRNLVSEILGCDLAALFYAVLVTLDKRVDNLVGHLGCLVGFPRLGSKLARGIANDPEVNVQSDSLEVGGDNVRLGELEPAKSSASNNPGSISGCTHVLFGFGGWIMSPAGFPNIPLQAISM